MVRRHLNPEVVWKSDRVHLSGLAVIVGYTRRTVMNDIRQDTIMKLMEHPMRSDDTFQFRCRQCGSCCRDRVDILLSPFDLCRMAKELGEPLHQVFDKYGYLYVGGMSKVPLVSLKMREDNGQCYFLSEDNRCSIQMNKPAVCALFPLGRCASRKEDGTEIFYIVQPSECGERDECYTPREWMGEFKLEESEEWFRIWQDVVMAISERINEVLPMLPEGVVNDILSGMGGILYLRYDVDKPLIPQVKENGEHVLRMISMLEDTVKSFRAR